MRRPSQFTSGVYELRPGEWTWHVGFGLYGSLSGWCDNEAEAQREAARMLAWAETWPES